MTSLPEWALALKAAQCLSVRAGHITNEHQLGWSWLLYPFSVMCVLVIAITNYCLQLLTLVPAARTATTLATRVYWNSDGDLNWHCWHCGTF